MAAEPLLPVYLLVGSDRPKNLRALRRLRSRFGAEAVDHLLAESASGADAVAACNALGLFGAEGGGRLVIEWRWSTRRGTTAMVLPWGDASWRGTAMILPGDRSRRLTMGWNIIGHRRAVRSLQRAVASGTLAHAYLVTGPAQITSIPAPPQALKSANNVRNLPFENL